MLLTPIRRCISGVERYLSSQAGNSGERSLRYSRISGVRLRRQRFLQVVISSILSLRLKKLLLVGVTSTTSPSVTMLAEGVRLSSMIAGVLVVARDVLLES